MISSHNKYKEARIVYRRRFESRGERGQALIIFSEADAFLTERWCKNDQQSKSNIGLLKNFIEDAHVTWYD